MALVLASAARAQLLSHARRAFPHEACGVLLGRRVGDSARVEEARAVDNEAVDTRHAFVMGAAQLMDALGQAESGGREVVGFYHSHPGSAAVPSADDERSAWPALSYVIVSVQPTAQAQLTSWRREGTRLREEPVSGL